MKEDRRKNRDRRQSTGAALFPLFDCDDTLVRKDRRVLKDRRVNDLVQKQSTEPPHTEKAENRLFIWFRDDVREVEREDEGFWLGRSNSCATQIANRFVSRQHARFYYEDDAYYLADTSSNGTYLKNDDGETFITQEKVVIKGSGIISLGIPFDKADDDVIHYFIG